MKFKKQPFSLTSLFAQIRTVRRSGGDNHDLRIIQDDLLHPILGGNKLRKLDALMPDLGASGVTDLVIHHKTELIQNFPVFMP